MRISVGYGLENLITDVFAADVITENITPQFRNENFYAGIDNAIDVIKNELMKADVKHYFTMPWDIKNFEEFLSKYPESVQRCDALMYLGRFLKIYGTRPLLKP